MIGERFAADASVLTSEVIQERPPEPSTTAEIADLDDPDAAVFLEGQRLVDVTFTGTPRTDQPMTWRGLVRRHAWKYSTGDGASRSLADTPP